MYLNILSPNFDPRIHNCVSIPVTTDFMINIPYLMYNTGCLLHDIYIITSWLLFDDVYTSTMCAYENAEELILITHKDGILIIVVLM